MTCLCTPIDKFGKTTQTSHPPMDLLRNPCVPGAGTPPPERAGRHALMERAERALGRIQAGRAAKRMTVVGLRGVGKPVLLVRQQRRALRVPRSFMCSVTVKWNDLEHDLADLADLFVAVGDGRH
jgi:hypothetical protein